MLTTSTLIKTRTLSRRMEFATDTIETFFAEYSLPVPKVGFVANIYETLHDMRDGVKSISDIYKGNRARIDISISLPLDANVDHGAGSKHKGDVQYLQKR